jgi:predicted glycoside hydrolase/deacetylase ChbG (UPF0249 family)
MRKILGIAFLVLAAASVVIYAQTTPAKKSLAEKLGYARDAKLVIVHADDLGMTHSVNAASIKGLESGLVTSASIMVPCPWFPEMAEYAKAHTDADFGLHLTLTSERVFYRWGPVAARDKVPSLVDSNGYFHLNWNESTHIDAREVESELRAQMERALAMGVRPTHLDSHQYRLFENGKEIFQSVLRVAHEYKLPVFVVRDWFAERPYLEAALGPEDLVVDHTVTMEPGVAPEKWADLYVTALKNLRPGVTVFIIHLATMMWRCGRRRGSATRGVQLGVNGILIFLQERSSGNW